MLACTRGTDHEQLGDRRYAEKAWADALAEYRLAARQHKPSLELRSKIGAAALHAGELAGAAAAYHDLGLAGAAERGEATDGLMRTARAAIAARDVAGLRAAVTALREFAPSRLAELGSGLIMALDDAHRAVDADLVLSAAATASAADADSLVAIWADATARSGRCDLASRTWEALARRSATPAIVRASKGGQAGCQVDAGRSALAAGQLDQAEAAFRAAIALGMPDSTVRTAWLLIGDARWANADTAVAIESYRKAMAGADDDNPIAQRAREQLQRLTGTPGTP